LTIQRVPPIDHVPESPITVRSILRKYYEVSVAKSGSVGFQVLTHKKADLILLDIEMPEMDGFEFMELLQDKPDFKDIPVIFVTSTATPEFVLKASKAGAKGYVVKPVDPDILLKKVEDILKNSANEKTAEEAS
jgi:putative two-component system response regulator